MVFVCGKGLDAIPDLLVGFPVAGCGQVCEVFPDDVQVSKERRISPENVFFERFVLFCLVVERLKKCGVLDELKGFFDLAFGAVLQMVENIERRLCLAVLVGSHALQNGKVMGI